MPDNRTQIRQKRLLDQLEFHGLDALVLNPGPTLWYLTGISFHLSERPIVTIYRVDGPPIMILPELEAGKLADATFEGRAITYGEDPSTWPRAFEAAAAELSLDYQRVGVEPTRLRVLELRLLEEAAPRAAYLSGESVVAALRATKDEQEIRLMRRAAQAAETALQTALQMVQPGITERELAQELVLQLLRSGSAPELPFFPIVAFGPNAADPHAVPTQRALKEGEVILVDWGANVDGYFSDLTRVFTWGDSHAPITEIAGVVAEANSAARDCAAPGILASEVDRAARDVIKAAGYGAQFTHRTGHGLGLDVHEAPYIRSDNDEELVPGMVFTIEPGIYLPDVGGVRIEDDVVMTDDGCASLSSMERRLVDLRDGAAWERNRADHASGGVG